MRNIDVFKKILSEATALPESEIEKIAGMGAAMFGPKKLYETIPDDEAEKLLTELRKELPGIRKWALDGIAKNNQSGLFNQN